jgi:HAE1 family hydrophobic/amphiphilic exporter-1
MKIYETSVKNPISTIWIFIGIVAFGIFSFQRLSIDLYPDMDIPFISVFTQYPGASAADIEKNITDLLESNLNTVNNLKRLTSQSQDNFSLISVQFEWGTNLDEASNDIRDAVARVEQFLPTDAQRPSIMKLNMSMIPILFLTVTAEESFPALGKMLEERVVNELNRIDGVGSVGISGAPVREVQVNLDPIKMEAYNLTIEQIGQVIASENLNMPAGSMDIGTGFFAIRTEGEFANSDQIKGLVVSRIGGNTVLLSDVATVSDTTRKITQELLVNGRPGAQIVVQKQSGANSVAIANTIVEQLPIIAKTLPPDVKIEVFVNTAEFIQGSINSLTNTVLIAFICVSLVVLFFLGSFRATFIIVLTIPVSLVTSFIYLMVSGGSLNVITLTSLIICISLVVDDAIVVLENISKHIERGSSPREAAIYATNEVWLAVIATTLTLIAVFFPLTLVGGMAGVLFKPLGWIVCIVTTLSTVAAITLTPMLSSKLLRFKEKVEQYKGFGIHRTIEKMLGRLDAAYAVVLTWALRRKLLVMIACFLIFVSSIFLLLLVPSDFMPESDQSQLILTIELDQGRGLEYTKKITQDVTEYIVAEFPEVVVMASATGAADGSNFWAAMSASGSHIITIQMRFQNVKERERDVFLMGDLMREKLATIPEIVKYSVSTGGGGFGGGADVEVKIFGYDFNASEEFAKELMEKFQSIKGTRDLQLSRDEMRLEYRVVFDREKLAFYGLNTATASTFIRNRINGLIASRYREDGEEYDIVVRYDEQFRGSLTDIENIKLYGSGGQSIRVKDIGSVVEFFSPPSIQHENRQRMISVNMSLHNTALSRVVRDIREILAETETPQGIAIPIGGNAQEQEESFGDLGLLALLVILLVYIVLATQFESMRMPFIVLLSVVYAFTGVFLALFITKTSLNLISFIGAIMLIGIVVKNGVVIVDFTNLLHERGFSLNQAVINAGKSRLRPVLMTSITTILGMLPLALGLGEGSEIWRPMGVAIVGGLTFSTLLTLIVVPVTYSIFGARTLRKRRRKQIIEADED